MDITKAFNTVPHKRLRLKLQWYGIVSNTYRWISSFLSDRHQKLVHISCVWCPSGNSSGPHIIINDVIENIKHSKIWLFADDISAVRDAQQLQEDL